MTKEVSFVLIAELDSINNMVDLGRAGSRELTDVAAASLKMAELFK